MIKYMFRLMGLLGYVVVLTVPNTVLGHEASFKDIERYKYEFDDYNSINRFISHLDQFSELHGHLFLKQKALRGPSNYFLKITDERYQISCSNISFSLEMHCRASILKGLDGYELDAERWALKAHLQGVGFSHIDI